MREAVRSYLYENTSFEQFGTDHVLGLLISVFLIIFIPWVSVKYLNRKTQRSLGVYIGYVVMLNYPVWVLLEITAGSFDSINYCHPARVQTEQSSVSLFSILELSEKHP